MDHRVEQIMVAIVGKLTGLATTGTHVFRGRIYEVPEANLPALLVYQGADQPRTDGGSSSFRYLDGDLSVQVEAAVKVPHGTQPETVLNQIRKEVTVALQADVTQGLGFVMDTNEGAAVPDLTGEGDKPTARLRMEWVIRYRRSRTDPSA